MSEWRHRYNQHVSEQRRLGFLRIGHYDTWLIDYLQIIVEHNHGVLLYPDWSNTSNYATTREKFGTVAIHSPQLAKAINSIELNKDILDYRLMADQQYLCKTMGTKLPLLPVVRKEECQLFERLALLGMSGFRMSKKCSNGQTRVCQPDISPTCRPTCWQHDQKRCRPRYWQCCANMSRTDMLATCWRETCLPRSYSCTSSTSVRHYAITPVHQYASTPVCHYAITPLCQYASMPVRQYASTPVPHYTIMPLRQYVSTPVLYASTPVDVCQYMYTSRCTLVDVCQEMYASRCINPNRS